MSCSPGEIRHRRDPLTYCPGEQPPTPYTHTPPPSRQEKGASSDRSHLAAKRNEPCTRLKLHLRLTSVKLHESDSSVVSVPVYLRLCIHALKWKRKRVFHVSAERVLLVAT